TARGKIDTISIADLGFTLVPVTLTEEQRSLTRHASSTAFLVTGVDPTGLASDANLMIGDIVIKVNEEMVGNLQVLADVLRLRNHTSQISFLVLRGSQLVPLSVEHRD